MVSDGPAGPVHLGTSAVAPARSEGGTVWRGALALLLYLRPEQLQQKLSDLWTTACRQEEKELDLASALSLSNVSSDVQQRMQSELPPTTPRCLRRGTSSGSACPSAESANNWRTDARPLPNLRLSERGCSIPVDNLLFGKVPTLEENE